MSFFGTSTLPTCLKLVYIWETDIEYLECTACRWIQTLRLVEEKIFVSSHSLAGVHKNAVGEDMNLIGSYMTCTFLFKTKKWCVFYGLGQSLLWTHPFVCQSSLLEGTAYNWTCFNKSC